MGHQNDGVTLLVQLLEDGHHLLAAVAVEGAGGLVRQDHLAAIGQRPGYADPLLLAAGELARPVVAAIAQAQAGQQGAGTYLALGAGGAGIDGGDLHVGGRIQMGQQMVALEDEAEVVAAQPRQGQGIQAGGVLTTKQVLAAARAIEAAQQVHQGGLAGAGGTDYGHHLPRRYGQIQRVQHSHLVLPALVAALNALELDQGLAHGTISISSFWTGLPCSRVTLS